MRETVLGFLGAIFLRFIHASLFWKKCGLDVPSGSEGKSAHWSYAEPVIVAFWHCDQLMGPWAYLGFKPPHDRPNAKRRPAYVLISEHSDGRIIAAALKFLSIENIPGSSTRGGVRALVKMKKKIEKDRVHITITPDGPKGPAREVKAGVITLSAQTGVPILPIGFAYSRAWRAKSWDKMVLPKPFSKARMVGGELISVPKELSDETLEMYRTQLTDELNRVGALAEKALYNESSDFKSNLSDFNDSGENLSS